MVQNTDGWDTYRSSNIVIQNSWIDNYDGMWTQTVMLESGIATPLDDLIRRWPCY